ncbi:short-chain collagen C4-like isoform X1 [Pomacea canaliculata]|uniref:short-chain collagen C4-like isoform X1 n=1 Tax=Pomacea canaliculata TaxID=400727 RepID=UPI000D73F4AA|nr:short-chain collagen C4-like isoform X1 [Pomacea canaliculata]
MWLVELLLVSLVSSATLSLAVDPGDSQGASSGLQEQDKRAVDSVELQVNILDLATKEDLDELRSWATGRLAALVTELQTVTSQLQSALPLSSSSLYTRWGSKTCSNTSTQVYKGVIGGGNHAASGSAVNALCLTLNPVYDGHNPTTYSSNLYGMEYETTPEEKQDQDGVCSVCRVHRSTTLMIPGTNVCPNGWTLEYSGYLMAGYDSHPASSEYICVDKKQDARYGSNADYNGKLFYYTVGSCGSLPCPPYVQGKVVTCVVCSN